MRKTIKLFMLLVIVVSSYLCTAQGVLTVFPDWQSTTGSQNFFYKNVTKTDASNNVYIAGATMNGYGNYDMLLVKYNSSGTLQWTKQYDGGGSGPDVATALYIDASGNVYITGFTTTTTNVDMLTIKYNSSGTQQWISQYNGSGNSYDSGADITGDANAIYVTGSSYNNSGNTDVVTVKYNFSGTPQWTKTYNGAPNLNDAGMKVSIGASYLTVSVISQSNSTTYRYAVLYYNPNNGNLISGTINGSSTTGIDQVNDMVEDASGNIYIVGATPVTGHGYDIDVVKLNTSLGIAWQQTYNGAGNLDDIGKGIAVDASGNVFITGYTTTSNHGKDIVTIKYNSSGTQQWVNIYNDPQNGDDEGAEMAIDASGNIYVTGYITTATDKADFYTIKYNGSGTEIWNIHNDNTAHLNDKAVNIAIDNVGDIVVTGVSETSPNVYEYLTLKYTEKSIITPTDYYGESPLSSFPYYRNMGQIINSSDSLEPTIKFYEKNKSPEYYIKKNSFSFVFAKIDTVASTTDTLHRIDVTFDKVNSSAKAYSLEEQPDYVNYYLGHCPDGITEIHGNKRVVTPNLYSNIDLMYCSNQNGIKYYFIVKPGGNPADIAFVFTGASSFNLNGSTNALTINSSIGSLTFKRPTMYQLETNNHVDTLTGWTPAWQTNGASNKYKFYVGSYTTTKPLIIEIDCGKNVQQMTQTGNLEWSTYFGGGANDYIFDVTNSTDGNVYATGYGFSAPFPITGLSYGTNLGDGTAFVLSFQPYGTPRWATYYGGNGGDGGLGITTDSKGNVFFTGFTSLNGGPDPNSFPTYNLSGAYYHQPSLGPDYAFVVKLNQSNGQRTWATVFGDDNTAARVNGITIDHDVDNNIYIGGKGIKINNFPIAGYTPFCVVHQQSTTNHSMGFVAEFDNTSYGLLWSTLFGNTGTEVRDMALASNKDLYITGFTTVTDSALFPEANDNNMYYSHIYNGGTYDAFIAKFNLCHELKWGTFFGGTDLDKGYGICLKGGSVFITGATNSGSGSFPLIDNSNANSLNVNVKDNNTDGFISSFATDGNIGWSTYFGGNGTDECHKICANDYGNLFVTGQTNSSPKDEPATNLVNGYVQSNLENVTPIGTHADAFVLGFDFNLNFLWSTYFGGETTGGSSDDIGWGISSYGSDKLYIAGQSHSLIDFPVYYDDVNYPNAYTQQNGGVTAYDDGFIAQFGLSNTLLPVNEIVSQNDLNFFVYPNPNNGEFTIASNNIKGKETCINIYNSIGQLIYSKKYSISNGALNQKINIVNLPKGIYLVSLIDKNAVNSKKVIVY